MLKISAFNLEKQKSVIAKKYDLSQEWTSFNIKTFTGPIFSDCFGNSIKGSTVVDWGKNYFIELYVFLAPAAKLASPQMSLLEWIEAKIIS